MNDARFIEKYVQAGFKLIPLKGYSPENPQKDYKFAKTPAQGVRGFTEENFTALSVEDAERKLSEGFWLGGVIPKNLLFIDAEDEKVNWLNSYFQTIQVDPSVHTTKKGVHYGFKYQGNGISGDSMAFCKAGFKITYRAGGKNFLVLAPSDGRTWKLWKDFSDLPDLPEGMYPLNHSQDDVLKAITEQLSIFYGNGTLAGYGDIELSFLTEIIKLDVPIERIKNIFHRIFGSEYDENRTAKMIERTQSKIKNGDALITVGSLITKFSQIGLEHIGKLFSRLGKTKGSASKKFPLTDSGNAERLVGKCKEDIRYCPEWKKWLIWDGCRWTPDTIGRIFQLAKIAVRGIYEESAWATDDAERKAIGRWAIKSETSALITAMISLAKTELDVPISVNELDANLWLLNCKNGTVDLRTGELKLHDKNDLITKIIPVEYDPNAECPIWLKFLGTVFENNVAVIEYIQKAIGYSFSGDISEQCLFICYGTGANGKSTFLRTLQSVLGDYAQTADFDTFLVKKSDGARNDIARMQGRRFIAAIEAGDGRRLAETLIKQITGGDVISARYLYAEFFEFIPTFKIWLAANHKPVIRESNNAIWRRIRLIPFNTTIDEKKQDRKLLEKLLCEKAGILRWAVEGCLEWQRTGLGTPEEIKNANVNYKNEMDIIGNFIDDCCILDPLGKTPSGELYQVYEQWAKANGELPIRQRTFGVRLTERGLSHSQSGGKRYRNGIILNEDVVPQVPHYSL